MSLLAEIADRLHFSLVCKRAAQRVQRRLGASTPDEGQGAMGQGLHLRGKVVDPQWAVGPLTGAQVVGYRLLVETVGRYWMNRHVLIDYCEVADFFVEGEEGKRAVRGAGARLIVSEPCYEGRRAGGSEADPKAFPEPVLAILADRAQFRPEAQDPRHYRWHEYHLHEGDEVFLDGRWGRAQGASQEAEQVFGSFEGQPLLISRVPRDELLRELQAPDERIMRLLPRMVDLGDRD